MNVTPVQGRPQRDRAFGVVVGGYGSLWGLVGLLAMFIGLASITDEGLGSVAGMLLLVFVAPPTLLYAGLSLICAVGLWQGRGWARPSARWLAALHLLGALWLVVNQLWVVGLIAAVLSALAWWYLGRTRSEG